MTSARFLICVLLWGCSGKSDDSDTGTAGGAGPTASTTTSGTTSGTGGGTGGATTTATTTSGTGGATTGGTGAGTGTGSRTDTGPRTDTGTPTDTASPIPTWTQDVQPALFPVCGFCHDSVVYGGCFQGSVQSCWLDSYADVTAAPMATACGSSATVAECLPVRMAADHHCVTGQPGCVSLDDLAMVERWVAAGFPE